MSVFWGSVQRAAFFFIFHNTEPPDLERYFPFAAGEEWLYQTRLTGYVIFSPFLANLNKTH